MSRRCHYYHVKHGPETKPMVRVSKGLWFGGSNRHWGNMVYVWGPFTRGRSKAQELNYGSGGVPRESGSSSLILCFL